MLGLKGLWSRLAWRFSKLPAPLQVFSVALGLAIVSIAGVEGARFFDYAHNDPRFCRSCHAMEKAWDRWAESAHRSVSCQSCHEQSALASIDQIVMYVAQQSGRVSKHAAVADESCDRCHESSDPRWLRVAATGGHKTHAEATGVSCTKCHTSTLHRFEPSKEICGTCHGEQQIKIPEMANLHCLTCHDFHATQTDLFPDRDRCLACHRTMPQTKVTWPADAPMGWKCGACHKPHEQPLPVVDCGACHLPAQLTGLHTSASHAIADCQSCHRPHAWRVAKRDICLACHANKTEHNPGPLCAQCHTFTGTKVKRTG